jgi:hypothetical protein
LTGSITKTEGLHFAVAATRFNEIVTKPLVEGALEAFRRHSIREEDIDVIRVPGSFEIPLVSQMSGKYPGARIPFRKRTRLTFCKKPSLFNSKVSKTSNSYKMIL